MVEMEDSERNKLPNAAYWFSQGELIRKLLERSQPVPRRSKEIGAGREAAGVSITVIVPIGCDGSCAVTRRAPKERVHKCNPRSRRRSSGNTPYFLS